MKRLLSRMWPVLDQIAIFILARSICRNDPDARAVIQRIVEREVDAIRFAADDIIDDGEAEIGVIADRLVRRYDPAMALTEAYQRAIKRLQDDKVDFIHPSSMQKAAMRQQQASLKGILRQHAIAKVRGVFGECP